VILNSGSTNFVDIAAGPDYGLALDEFGVVWRWGQGLNFTGNVQGLSNIVAIAAGGDAGSYHNLALDQSGTVWAWGNNESGQLGNGSFVDGGPVSVSGISNAVAIAAGTIDGNGAIAGTDSHSVARKSDGTVWTWGANWAGQLGNGTTNTTANATPAPVPGVTTAVGVTAGGAHTLALLADKSVSSWGANKSGQLGDGSKTARSSLGAVGLTNPNAANFVEAGAAHSTFTGQTVPNLVMSKVGCSVSPTVNFYNSPFGSTHVLADAFGVITNSLKQQPPCVPFFTGEVGASDVLEVTAPSDGVANLG
jgi:alpha-tubulin suppressor-like RCC1 family protein